MRGGGAPGRGPAAARRGLARCCRRVGPCGRRWRPRRRSALAGDGGGGVLGVGPGIGRLEVDDVAKQDLAGVELVAPDDDRLEGQRRFAEPRDHRLAAGLDALGDGDLALAGEKLDRAHLAEIHADRIVGAVGRLARRLGGDRGRRRLGEFAGLGLFLARLLGLLGLVGLDDVDAHVVEHGVDVLDLVGGHFAVEGRTPFSSSW